MSYKDKYLKYKKKYLDIKNNNNNNNINKNNKNNKNNNIIIGGSKDPWWWHLSIDAKNTNDKVKDKKKIKEFGDKLIKKIDMIKFGKPKIVHFGEKGKEGWTYVQLITTSNICCHYCDDNTMFLDIFSCKIFDKDIVINLVKEFYDISDII